MTTRKENYGLFARLTRLAFSIACFLVLASATANAQGPCTPVNITPPTDPALLTFEVEGKITAYDRTNRTITANGTTFYIPTTVLVETRDLDLTGNIQFADLTNPALEAQRTIIGGSVRASGDVIFNQTTSGYCMSFQVTSVFVELAENVLSGLLSNVDIANSSFRVNGTTVRLNTDPRFPSSIIDLGTAPITINDLAGHEGTLVTAEGYYDSALGVLLACVVETEIVKTVPGGDGVAITRTEGRTGNRELRLEGQNARSSVTGAFAANVSVYSGGLSGSNCTGTLIGTAAVSAVDGSWSFRQRPINTVPTQVCVKSPLGGFTTRAVEIRD